MPIDEAGISKVALALIAVVLGWTLSQATEFAKTRFRSRRIKKALLMELSDIKIHLQRICAATERNLQIFAIDGIEPSVSTKISHRMFELKYPDVFVQLSHAQRNSYETTHAAVEAVNANLDRLLDFLNTTCGGIGGRERKNTDLAQWGELIKVQYLTTCSALWHVTFHLNNPRTPELTWFDTEVHQHYVDDIEASRERIIKIVADAKSLKKEDFQAKVI